MNCKVVSPERVVHFGPVWGRQSGHSMALCVDEPGKPGESRTLTRDATVTCPECLRIIAAQRHLPDFRKGRAPA